MLVQLLQICTGPFQLASILDALHPACGNSRGNKDAGETKMANKTRMPPYTKRLSAKTHFQNNKRSFQSPLSSFISLVTEWEQRMPGNSLWYLGRSSHRKNLNQFKKQVNSSSQQQPHLLGLWENPHEDMELAQDNSSEFHKATSAKTNLHLGQNKAAGCLHDWNSLPKTMACLCVRRLGVGC